ncbi:helix-turn-helix domain-containing protein [Halomarina salina]|uniref:Helix-turn-helix domain-containing protein n=1 Tax=Halomarina salina TaxID=1872699 RepID=A0ABD5RNI2_9EURY|nr:helix-turn-helix domain-containing protein [Halomarina salina]
MREFVFTVEYERGADEVMDLFIEHPDLYARSMEVNATDGSVWGIDKVVGPSEALNEFDKRLERVTNDPNATGMCGAPVTDWTYETLSSNPESRKIYSLRSEGDEARSIPLVAAERVGDGLIMRTERRANQFRWHLLVDDTVSELHDEVRENLRDGLSLTVERLGTPPCLREDGRVQRSLTPEQKAALEAAIEHGYYDVPRQQPVTEIAAEIDVSSSTLQYRLNRAEAWLAHQFAADSVSVDVDAELDLEDIEFVR